MSWFWIIVGGIALAGVIVTFVGVLAEKIERRERARIEDHYAEILDKLAEILKKD